MSAAKPVDLWAIYYPGKTPEQAYNEARAENDKRHSLARAGLDVTATFDDCLTPAGRDDYWRRLAAAKTALRRHDGVPDQWIDGQGNDVTPDGICRECWRPGATEAEECNGRVHHYHPACHQARSIRCDLRCAAWARINGDEDRAAMWERMALAKHEGGAS